MDLKRTGRKERCIRFISIGLLFMLLMGVIDYGICAQHQYVPCPVWNRNGRYAPFLPCSGINNNVKFDDSAFLYSDLGRIHNHMSGREALDLIKKIRQGNENCRNYEKNKVIPILNITFQGDQFRKQAEIAVELANVLSDFHTQGSCAGFSFETSSNTNSNSIISEIDENYLYAMVRNAVEASPGLSGCAISFDQNRYKNFEYFSPYAFQKKTVNSLGVKDLSTSWGTDHLKFLENAKTVFKRRSILCKTSFLVPRYNQTMDLSWRHHTHAYMKYDDGIWGRPHFQCAPAKAWLVGYEVPFFAFNYNTKPQESVLEFM